MVLRTGVWDSVPHEPNLEGTDPRPTAIASSRRIYIRFSQRPTFITQYTMARGFLPGHTQFQYSCKRPVYCTRYRHASEAEDSEMPLSSYFPSIWICSARREVIMALKREGEYGDRLLAMADRYAGRHPVYFTRGYLTGLPPQSRLCADGNEALLWHGRQ